MSHFISSMGLFILMLAFTDGSPKDVHLFTPTQLYVDDFTRSLKRFQSLGPIASYSGVGPEPASIRINAPTEICSCYCGQFVTKVGEAPIEAGKWFKNQSSVDTIRGRILKFCGIKTDDTLNLAGQRESSSLKLFVIYQRDLDRRIIDLPDIVNKLKKRAGPNWSFIILHHSEATKPCEYQRLLGNADILLTAHGFQSLALLFMKKGATLFEIYNYKYWKPGIKTLLVLLSITEVIFLFQQVISQSLLNMEFSMLGFKTRPLPRSVDNS